MSKQLRLSVVVPAHNAAPYISRTLAALAESSLSSLEWELIVVDDASTDETKSIAERYSECVIVTGETPRGPAYARNCGAKVAKGEIIAFVDADVVIDAGALASMIARLDEDVRRVAVFGAYDDEPEERSLVSSYRNLLHHYTHVQTAGDVATFWAGCGAVKSEAFRAAGGFDENRFPRPQIEDIELGYRLRKQGAILLDPAIRGKHLKRWSALSMMRTDFSDRAVPWTRLLLAARSDKGASNPSLGLRPLVATVLSGIGALLLIVAVMLREPSMLILAAIPVAIVIALNAKFYAFLLRKRGWPMVSTAIPLHYGYYLLSAVAVPVGAAQYLMFDGTGNAPSTTGRRFVPLASGEIASRLVAFIATAYLARTLGAASFGVIAFGMAFVNHFGTAMSVGIGELGSREVARDPERAAAHAAAGVSLRLIVAAAAIGGIIGISLLLHIDMQKRVVTWLFALTLIPMALDTAWVYKGLGATLRVGKSMILDQTLCLILIIALVHSAAHQTRVPLIQMMGDFAGAAFLGIPLMRGKWSLPARGEVRALASRASLVTLSRFLRMIVISFDIVLLGVLVSSREVGWYSAAYRIVFFVMAILYASHSAFLPEIARSAHDSRAMGAIMSKSIGLALSVTAPFIVGGVLLAPSVLGLIYGADYVSGASAFRLLLLSLVFLSIHAATRSVFISMQRMGMEAVIIATGVAVNLVMNFVLIPRMGINGAGIAAVAGEAVTMIGAVSALIALGVRPDVRLWVSPLIASAALAAAISLVADAAPIVLTIMIGAIVYVMTIGALTVATRRRQSLLPAQ